MFTAEALTFFTVTVFVALAPTTTLLKLADDGEKVRAEAPPPVPLPLRATSSGVKATPSLTAAAPLIEPF